MFICPSCGDSVEGEEDLIICDECLNEANEIRKIKSQLSLLGMQVKLVNWLDEGQWILYNEQDDNFIGGG